MNKRLFLLPVLLAMLLVFSGCNLPTIAPVPTATEFDLAAIQTAAAQTREAQDGGGIATVPPLLATDTPSPPTETPAPTNTPFPTATPTVAIPCDRVSFIKDVTIPDGKDFPPGDTFTKTWRLRNNGSCTWTSDYDLVFANGDSMGGPASVSLTGTVAPNQTVDVSVDLTAPNSPGTYRGNWKLRNASGQVFGLGDSASPFYVEIEVVATVNFSIEFENTHICSGNVYATVKIVNTGAEFLLSARVKVEDLDDSAILYGPASNNKPFVITPTGCPPGENDADPGLTYYIAVDIGPTPPSGHTARYTLQLCTEDALSGTCVEKSIEFEIP